MPDLKQGDGISASGRQFLAKFLVRVPRGAPVLAAISVVNVALSCLREATIAYYFGTSAELDTFLVAAALPKLLINNLAQITVAVVLPLYIAHRQLGRSHAATSLVRGWFWFSGGVIAVGCVVLFLTADLLMTAMAPGFDPSARRQAAAWLRTLLPHVWLLGMVGTFKVVLNSHDRFAVPALSNQVVTLSVMVCCIAAANAFGARALVGGLVIGALLSFTWQLLHSRRFEPAVPGLGRLLCNQRLPLGAAGAMLLHSAAVQVDVVVDRAFASGLSEGSVAAYNYALLVNSIPQTMVTSVLATTLFPVLARSIAAGASKRALGTVQKWSTVVVALGVGPVLLLMTFREQVVSLVFERGAFGRDAVVMTADVLRVLPLLILVTVVSALFTQLLLAQGRARAVAVLGAIAITLKISLNLVLVPHYGLTGLALATLGAATVATVARVTVASLASKQAA